MADTNKDGKVSLDEINMLIERLPGIGEDEKSYMYQAAQKMKEDLEQQQSFGKKKRRRKKTAKRRKKTAKRRKKTSKKTPMKKHTGWCIKKRRVVKVYKIKGLVGRRFYDKKKVPKRTRCYKTKAAAQRAIGTRKRKRKYNRRTHKYYWVYDYNDVGTGGRSRHRHNAGRLGGTGCSRRYNQSDCSSNPNCKWEYGRCSTRGGGGHTSSYQGPMNKQGFGRVVNPANVLNYQYQQYANNVATPTVGQIGMISQTPSYAYPVKSGMSNSAWYVPKQNFGGYGF